MRIVQEKQVEVIEKPMEQEKPSVVETKVQEMVATKPTTTSPWNIKEEVKPKKKTFGTKSWWIFKAPILLYLLASSGYVYLSSKALATYMTNPYLMYALLGLHVIIIMMFILLCIMTRGKKHDRN